MAEINWGLLQTPDIGMNALAAFEHGRAQRKQEMAQNALAAYATNPNEQTLNAVAPYNPQMVIERKQAMQKDQRAAMLEGAKVIGEAALYADTPEKWDAAVDHLAQFYPQLAEYKGRFSPELRNAAIASAGEIKTKFEMEKPVTVGPGSHLVDPATGKPKFSAPFAPRPVTVKEGEKVVEYAPGAGGFNIQNFARAIVQQESGGNYSAVNRESGAMGAYQVMPQTGKAIASRIGLPWRPDLMTSKSDEAKQYQDAIGQAAIKDAYEAGNGDPRVAASYYHGGPNRSGWGPKTQKYAEQVTGRLGQGGGRVIADGGPKRDNGEKAPVGYRWKQDGTLEPIPGGPQDKSPRTEPGYSQSALDAFDRAIESGNRLLKHPGFSTAVGAKGITGGLLGGWVIPGTDAADFKAELDAMKAQVFLPMVQSMKGMGALSNAEGEKLTAAIGALDPKMSEDGFRASLNRIIQDLQTYKARGMKQAAPAKPAAQAASNGPAKVIRYDAKGNRIP